MDVVLLYPIYMQAIRKPDKLKRDALILYVEGLGFRSIGRFLNVSHVTVFYWIKNFGEKLEELRSDHDIEVVEIDEIHTYISSKKATVTCRQGRDRHGMWIAVDRNGKQFINCEAGTRGTETGEKRWNRSDSYRIKDKVKGKVCTDYWKAYGEFVP